MKNQYLTKVCYHEKQSAEHREAAILSLTAQLQSEFTSKKDALETAGKQAIQITKLEKENQLLREENARLKPQVPGARVIDTE